MKTIFPKPLFVVLGALIVAVTAQLIPKQDRPYFVPPEPLKSVVSSAVSGWNAQDQPLGDTEFMQDRVQEILGFEDAFFRVYKRGATEVGVYVAYWKPGMTHPTDAATHSPDLCWINAGWREERHDYARVLEDGDGKPLKIAQFREFSMESGHRQQVVFWHMMGGELSGYALGPASRWKARLPVLWENQVNTRFGFHRREQFFIRVSTNQKIDDLVRDPLWREIIRGLGPMGLYANGG